jgi:hypothetical protein
MRDNCTSAYCAASTLREIAKGNEREEEEEETCHDVDS